MTLTQPPVFFKPKLIKDVNAHVKEYKERGYDVRSKVMFFVPLHCRKPRKVMVLVRCFKIDKYSNTPKMTILRANGEWR